MLTFINLFRYCISIPEGQKEDSQCLAKYKYYHSLKFMLKILSVSGYQIVSEYNLISFYLCIYLLLPESVQAANDRKP